MGDLTKDSPQGEMEKNKSAGWLRQEGWDSTLSGGFGRVVCEQWEWKLPRSLLRIVHGIEKSSNPEKTRSVQSIGHFVFFHVLGICSKTGVDGLHSIFVL